MAQDDVIMLNVPMARLEHRTNTRTGKSRFTISVSSEPIAINLDPKALGRPVAEALALHWRNEIKSITEVASKATLAARKAYAKAFGEGKPWATKRYSGGKTGPRTPNQSDRLFNDSGRFADTVTANASKDGAWRVNVAANRLSGDATTVARIWGRLVELVPSLRDVSLALQSNEVLAAKIKTVREMVTVGKMTDKPSGALDLMRALQRTLETVTKIARG